MRLIDITCPKCNATMRVNGDMSQCFCSYCGNKMLIDHQKTVIDNGFQFGYEQELGRQQAARDYQQHLIEDQKRAEKAKRQKDFTNFIIGVCVIFTIILFIIVNI